MCQTWLMLLIALVLALGLLGPILAIPRRLGIPVAIGEILVGVIFGVSGFNWVGGTEPTIHLLSQIGFALVMMSSASSISLSALTQSKAIANAARNVAISIIPAVAIAYGIATFAGFDLALVFAVIMFSSSAALVLPAFAGTKNTAQFVVFTTQVALADLLAIIALPLVIKGANFMSVISGAAIIAVMAYLIFLALRRFNNDGKWAEVRELSKKRRFGLELRISLIVLLVMAGITQTFGVTIMIASFSLGLAIGANGVPHRLSRQIFAVTEGFFSPLFFVVLGSQIDIRALITNPQLLLLSLALFAGAMVTHLSAVLFKLPVRFAIASAAQLGVPTAVIAIGQQTGILSAGQAAAIMLAALLTIGATLVTRRQVGQQPN